jgi:hypothetical protein
MYNGKCIDEMEPYFATCIPMSQVMKFKMILEPYRISVIQTLSFGNNHVTNKIFCNVRVPSFQ